MQPTYAPELKIVGAAIGGIIPNISLALGILHCKRKSWHRLTQTELYNKGERAYAIPPGILGISHDYKNLSKWLDENLEPKWEKEFRQGEHQCFTSNMMWENKDMDKYFKRGWKSVFDPLPNSVIQSACESTVSEPSSANLT
jgi:hypothetical protein